MSKLVEIDYCMECPHRTCWDYYGPSYCDLLDNLLLTTGCIDSNFGIHPDCPLPDVQYDEE